MRASVWLAGIVVAGLAFPVVTLAQEDSASAVAEAPRPDAPRGAILEYLTAGRRGDWERAATYLDLRALSPTRRTAEGPTLARQLKAVLDRDLWVEPEAVSNDRDGEADDGLPARFDRVGIVETRETNVEVLLERVSTAEGARWMIAASTVAAIPVLYAGLGYGPLATYLPALFFEIVLFDVQLWQWVGIIALFGASVFVSWIGTLLIVRVGRLLARRSKTTFDDTLLELGGGPLQVVLLALALRVGIGLLALAVPVHRILVAIAQAVTLAGVTWLVLRIIDMFARETQGRFAGRGNTAAVSVVPLARRTGKVVVGVLAVVVALQNFGFNVTGFLAGLGVVGLAAALAAQKTLENFFGGIMLIADRPVQVGDFCRFGDKVGTIEDIGLRATRVRTLDRTVVSVPNAEFSSLQLENFTQRDRIWLKTILGLRYETTPDQLRHVLIGLKRVLLAHPMIDPDPARVRFVGFGAYSLDLEVFAYVRTTDWAEFLAVREDVFLRFMDAVDASGTGFAFPSQTLYAGTDGGLDPSRTRAAEDEVARWRAEGRLHLPDDGTTDYPPKGSQGAE